MNEKKKCPFCAEEIKSDAIVCKHCGRELPGYQEKIENIDTNKIEDINSGNFDID